jgi:hypothetical protein
MLHLLIAAAEEARTHDSGAAWKRNGKAFDGLARAGKMTPSGVPAGCVVA